MRSRFFEAIGLCVATLFSSKVFASDVYDTDFPYQWWNFTSKPTTNINEVLQETNQRWSFLENMLDLFGINYAWSDKALSFIQIVINYVLALVWFIALVLIIYSFYMIFFGKSDDAIAKARKTVIWATIAILIMWLSAYIVNLLFYIYSQGL
jgi:hypothetical protein